MPAISHHPILASCLLAAMALLPTGCSLFHDDLPECPSGADVTFDYEYNLHATDLFADQVGAVTVYAYDAATRQLVYTKEESGAALAQPAYTMHLDLPAGDYLLHAVAGERDYSSHLAGAWTHFVRTAIADGSSADSFTLRLDRDATGAVANGSVEMERIFQAREGMASLHVDSDEDGLTQATAHIPLMRLTNKLKLSFMRTDFPSYIEAGDFDIALTDRNGEIARDNTLTSATTVTYAPFNTDVMADENGCMWVNAEICFPRVVESTGTTLTITDRRSGHVTTIGNFDQVLAAAREAYDYKKYSVQEYLDRENSFEVSLVLNGAIVKYIEVRVSILNWVKRIQDVDF